MERSGVESGRGIGVSGVSSAVARGGCVCRGAVRWRLVRYV